MVENFDLLSDDPNEGAFTGGPDISTLPDDPNAGAVKKKVDSAPTVKTSGSGLNPTQPTGGSVISPATPKAPPVNPSKSFQDYEASQGQLNDVFKRKTSYDSFAKQMTVPGVGYSSMKNDRTTPISGPNEKAHLEANQAKLQKEYKAAKLIADKYQKDMASPMEAAIDEAFKRAGGLKNLLMDGVDEKEADTDIADREARAFAKANGLPETGYAYTAFKNQFKGRVEYEKRKPLYEKAFKEEASSAKIGELQQKEFDKFTSEHASLQKIKTEAEQSVIAAKAGVIKQYAPEFTKLETTYKANAEALNAKIVADPAVRADADKFAQEAQKTLQAEVQAGQRTPEQANAYFASEGFEAEYNKRIDASVEAIYGPQSKAAFESYLAEHNKLNTKRNSQFEREKAEIKNQFEPKFDQALATVKGQFKISPELAKKVEDAYEKAVNTVDGKQASKERIQAEARSNIANFTFGSLSSLGSGLRGYGAAYNLPDMVVLGEWLQSKFDVADLQFNSLKDVLDPTTFSIVSGNIAGRMVPTIAASFAVSALTRGAGLPTAIGVGLTGGAAFAMESSDMAGSMYLDVLEQTGDAAKATRASQEVWNHQLAIIPAYALSGIPYFGNLLKGIKYVEGRIVTGAAIEIIDEAGQEIPQSAFEEGIRKTLTRKNGDAFDNLPKMDEMFTWKESGKTLLNILPVAVMGGGAQAVHSAKDFTVKQWAKASAKSFAAKTDLSTVSETNPTQFMFNLFSQKGENFTVALAETMFASGQIDKPTFEMLQASFKDMAEIKAINKRMGVDPKDTKALMAYRLFTDYKAAQASAQAEVDPDIKEMLDSEVTKKRKAWQSVYDRNSEAELVVMELANGERYVYTEQEASEALDKPEVQKQLLEGKIMLSTDSPKIKSGPLSDKLKQLQDENEIENSSSEKAGQETGSVQENKGERQEKSLLKGPETSPSPVRQDQEEYAPGVGSMELSIATSRESEAAAKVHSTVAALAKKKSIWNKTTYELLKNKDILADPAVQEALAEVSAENAARVEKYKGAAPITITAENMNAQIAQAKVGRSKVEVQVLDDVKRVVKATAGLIGKTLGKGLSVVIHDTAESTKAALEATGMSAQKAEENSLTRGFWLDKSGVIHLNMPLVQRNTTLHEGIHPIMEYIQETNPEAFNAAYEQLELLSEVTGDQRYLVFGQRGNGNAKLEALIELMADITAGKIDTEKPSIFKKIKDAINTILEKLGWRKIETIEDLDSMARVISESILKGKDISKSLGSKKVEKPKTDTVSNQAITEENVPDVNKPVIENVKDYEKIAVVPGKIVSSSWATGPKALVDTAQSAALMPTSDIAKTNPETYLRHLSIVIGTNLIGKNDISGSVTEANIISQERIVASEAFDKASDKVRKLKIKGAPVREIRAAEKERDALKKHFDDVDGKLQVAMEAISQVDLEKVVSLFQSRAKENLRWLYNTMSPARREIAKRWYDGANRIAQRFAADYGVSVEQAAGSMAALSSGTEWFTNVELAERTIATFNILNDKVIPDSVFEIAPSIMKASEFKELEKARGKKGSELTAEQFSYAIRAYSQATHGNFYYTLDPDGARVGIQRNKDGVTPTKLRWKSYGEIQKVIDILRDETAINKSLGNAHKIRNFYNNIADPNNTNGYATIDTHAVAAAHLMPFSNDAYEVKNAFGASGNSKTTGISGTYFLYLEAYQSLADELGIHPRELQSITWEQVRALMDKDTKRGVGSDEVLAIWDDHNNGDITHGEATTKIESLFGGFNPFPWERRHNIAEDATGKQPGVSGELSGGNVLGGQGGENNASGLREPTGLREGTTDVRQSGEVAQYQTIAGVEVNFPSLDEQAALKKERSTPEWTQSKIAQIPKSDVVSIAKIKDLLDGNKDFAIVTGSNPLKSALPEETNNKLNAAAQKWLKERGYKPKMIVGRYEALGEESFFVEGMTLADTKAFREEFQQDSVLHSEGMFYANAYEKRVKLEDDLSKGPFQTDTDFASAALQPDGSVAAFSLGFDFDNKLPIPKPQFQNDLVAGTYYEPHLTTDNNGNYVFFHVSNAPAKSILKGIDSSGRYSGKTSRDEKATQYGVASYYTKPDDGERNVGGDKYYVSVPQDKVYPIDTDPKNYRERANKKGNIKKQMADMARADGYEMIVGEWYIDPAGELESEMPALRADALKVLAPKEYTGEENFTPATEEEIDHPEKARYKSERALNKLVSEMYYGKSNGLSEEIRIYGGVRTGQGDETTLPTEAQFNEMTKGLRGKKIKAQAEEVRQMLYGEAGMQPIEADIMERPQYQPVFNQSEATDNLNESAKRLSLGFDYFDAPVIDTLATVARDYIKNGDGTWEGLYNTLWGWVEKAYATQPTVDDIKLREDFDNAISTIYEKALTDTAENDFTGSIRKSVREATGQIKERVRILTNDAKSLADVLRAEAKGSKIGFREGRDRLDELKGRFNAILTEARKAGWFRGIIPARTLGALARKANNIKTEESLTNALRYLDKILGDKDYSEKINYAEKLRAKVAKKMKGEKNTFGNRTPIAKRMLDVDPTQLKRESLAEYTKALEDLVKGRIPDPQKAGDQISLFENEMGEEQTGVPAYDYIKTYQEIVELLDSIQESYGSEDLKKIPSFEDYLDVKKKIAGIRNRLEKMLANDDIREEQFNEQIQRLDMEYSADLEAQGASLALDEATFGAMLLDNALAHNTHFDKNQIELMDKMRRMGPDKFAALGVADANLFKLAMEQLSNGFFSPKIYELYWRAQSRARATDMIEGITQTLKINNSRPSFADWMMKNFPSSKSFFRDYSEMGALKLARELGKISKAQQDEMLGYAETQPFYKNIYGYLSSALMKSTLAQNAANKKLFDVEPRSKEERMRVGMILKQLDWQSNAKDPKFSDVEDIMGHLLSGDNHFRYTGDDKALIRKIYNGLLAKHANANGTLNAEAALAGLSKSERKYYDAIRDVIDNDLQLKAKTATEKRGRIFNTRDNYFARFNKEVGEASISETATMSGMLQKMERVSTKASATESADNVPRWTNIDPKTAMIKNIREVNTDFYLSDDYKISMRALTEARKKFTGKDGVALDAMRLEVKESVASDLVTRADDEMMGALNKIIGGVRAVYLSTPERIPKEIIPNALKLFASKGNPKDWSRYLAKQFTKNKGYLMAMAAAGSPVFSKTAKLSVEQGQTGRESTVQRLGDRLSTISDAFNAQAQWIVNFDKAFEQETGQKFNSMAFADDPAYRDANMEAVEKAAIKAEYETERVAGPQQGFTGRRTISWFPGVVSERHLWWSKVGGFLQSYVAFEQAALLGSAKTLMIGGDKAGAARMIGGIMVSQMAFQQMSFFIATLMKNFADDDEENDFVESFDALMDPVVQQKLLVVSLISMATGGYGFAARILIASALGVGATLNEKSGAADTEGSTLDELTMVSRDYMFTKPLILSPAGGLSFDTMRQSASARDAINMVPALGTYLSTALFDLPSSLGSIVKQVQEDGVESLSEMDKNKYIFLQSFNLMLSVAGVQYPGTALVNKTLKNKAYEAAQEERAEKKRRNAQSKKSKGSYGPSSGVGSTGGAGTGPGGPF